jgi:hypothetical protein
VEDRDSLLMATSCDSVSLKGFGTWEPLPTCPLVAKFKEALHTSAQHHSDIPPLLLVSSINKCASKSQMRSNKLE